ncbi:hypothetical protein EB118_01160 [bacterium]|nr:hypothetical protein [bacterium]NBX97853.1 hypothetical protein [bacterium]NDC94294.1 hypothetical protein [bacterium]NDD84324.1 hypothetical protein [bacterium]NDG28697.1 hypothetical protein [bacterium]
MKRSRAFLVILFVGCLIALSIQQNKIAHLQRQAFESKSAAFRQQLKPGLACGLLTSKEAGMFLEVKQIISSGTIIPSDALTAAVRLGSPRIDSCTHTYLANNISYIDIVIKTYKTEQIATKAYNEYIKNIIYTEPGKLATANTRDIYATGAHYILKGAVVYEISASKVGSSNGSALKKFSDSVANTILQKL